VAWRKISDVATIETALQQYKADKNYYPPTTEYSTSNLWWYTWSKIAQPSNTIKVVYNGQEIKTIVTSNTRWWGKVFNTAWIQIWSKWVMSQSILWKKYLTKDLYDPELWDLVEKDSNKKFIQFWIWRYIYAIYKKWTSNTRWNDFNIAYTIKKQNSDKYITKISWSYDKESCYEEASECPDSLIWSWSVILTNDEIQKFDWWTINTTMINQGIPYPVTDFSK
jgi:hypothetical protein